MAILIFQHIGGDKIRLEVSGDNNVFISSKMTQYRIVPLVKVFSALKLDECKVASYNTIKKEKGREEFIKYLIKEFESKEMGGGFKLVKVINNGS